MHTDVGDFLVFRARDNVQPELDMLAGSGGEQQDDEGELDEQRYQLRAKQRGPTETVNHCGKKGKRFKKILSPRVSLNEQVIFPLTPAQCSISRTLPTKVWLCGC